MKTLKLLFVALIASQLSGCFFIWIPGSVIQGVKDAATGAEGKNCVSQVAKVGDTMRLPDGSTGTVKSLSGTSSLCTNPALPIRALIVSGETK